MAKRKTFSIPLSDELAQGVLQLPLTVGAETRSLAEWVEHLHRVQEAANELLGENTLTGFVADRVMKDIGKRGSPSLIFTPAGQVHLQVSYDEDAPKKTPVEPVAREPRSSDLPKLDDLRKRADEMGIDISHLGRQRRAIFDLLELRAYQAGQ